MSTVNNSIQDNPYLKNLVIGNTSQTTQSTGAAEPNNELGKDAFLELMVAQLKNQSPLNPTENGEFVAQLAQFSSVESLDNLNNRFDSFATSFQSNQALQASSLVGRSVTVPASQTQLPANGVVSGVAKMQTAASEVHLTISNPSGAVVDQIPLGSLPAGDHNFRWDGKQLELNGQLLDWQSSNESVPPGEYTFRVNGTSGDGSEQFDTSLSAQVSSVTMGADNKLTLNLKGMGSVDFDQIEQINQ
ncbi:flagellar hook assembly protein FlgD [Pseudoteredinibacter isoporae]|uniref:Basal-body rod modification protein FlgD n=1 Tax=Pseudoteredinibacter isoporae TaxID=570281 RepID=A0A7X0JWF3_9GAMM|nr:flagellar hook assembly protein FlgD [Pseudoteredinibacter isoporae]MBB6523497.1 flagellar basal-body rod modification protein FlgD [Pseudoteredinibacter isoporae]NHO89006.1 flagellar hook assembly protein FlgD [Pseudoteredinibacter isoporae]NIB24286.1 flagellar hook assembly protein FlgD [Pseudoteredinibacter isoporae]